MDYTHIQEVSTIWQGERKKYKEMDEISINLELCETKISGTWKNRKIIAMKSISYRPITSDKNGIQAVKSLINANLFRRLGE